MFIGDQYPMSDLGGLAPCIFRLSFIRRCRTPRIDPAAGAGTWSAGRGPRGPPWAPGGGLRGLKSQFSARVGDSHSLTRALVILPPWSLPLVFCAVPTPSPGPCFQLTLPWLPYSIPLTRVQCGVTCGPHIPGLCSPCTFPPPYPNPLIFISSSST